MRMPRIQVPSVIPLALLILLAVSTLVIINLIQNNNRLAADLQNTQATITPQATSESLITTLENGIVPLLSESDRLSGPKTAPVALFEYSDLECPYCKQYESTIKKLQEMYGDQIVRVFRHFPIVNIHPNAMMEAQVAECVAEAGGHPAFYQFIDSIFAQTTSTGSSISKEKALEIAHQVLPTAEGIEFCLQSQVTLAKINNDIERGKTAGVQGTPTIFVVNQASGATQMIVGSQIQSVFQQAIDLALK